MSILVALSRDHTRDMVLDVAIRLAEAFDEPLYIVHLIEGDGDASDASGIREELRQYVLEESLVATVRVEPVGERLARGGPKLGAKLLEMAADSEVTHIVVGHTSKGLFGDIKQGNTAFTVADTAPVPVTVVPETVDTDSP